MSISASVSQNTVRPGRKEEEKERRRRRKKVQIGRSDAGEGGRRRKKRVNWTNLPSLISHVRITCYMSGGKNLIFFKQNTYRTKKNKNKGYRISFQQIKKKKDTKTKFVNYFSWF